MNQETSYETKPATAAGGVGARHTRRRPRRTDTAVMAALSKRPDRYARPASRFRSRASPEQPHRNVTSEPAPRQTVLPFTPPSLPVDTGGNLYVSDAGTKRVLKLPAGASSPAVLPFSGLKDPNGVAVDTAGNIYIADYGNNRVLKLAAGASAQPCCRSPT
jgi:serine/threonine-protein kinase